MLLLGTLSALCLVVDVAVGQVKPETCRRGYDRCFQSSFADTLDMYDIPAAWSIADVLPSWNASVLPTLCSDYEQFASCMPKGRCSVSDQLVLEGIDDAWAFLCNNTSQDAAYYNYSACFQQSSAIQGTTYCNNTLYTKLNRLGNYDDQKTVDKACQYYDQYVSCLWVAINSVCGSSAADWHQTYIVNLQTPYVSEMLNCPDWGSNGDASTGGDDASIGGILVTTFVALSLLLMLFIVVVLAVVVARRRAKNQLSSRSSAVPHGVQDSSDSAPPNYTEPYVVFEPTIPEAEVVSATSDSSRQEAGDASNGCPQYRIRLVDPLTGRRTDGGVVNNNEFPMKTWPTVLMVPPPYNDQPPPSFSSQPGSDDVSGCVSETTVNGPPAESTGAAAADNYGFCPDADDKQKLPED